MNTYRVIFEGRKLGSIGKFERREVYVKSKSIYSDDIIPALGKEFEVNHLILREGTHWYDRGRRIQGEEK